MPPKPAAQDAMTQKAQWKLLFTTPNQLEASMVQGLLQENAIETLLLNRQDRSYPLLGGSLEIYVPVHLEALARRVMGNELLN